MSRKVEVLEVGEDGSFDTSRASTIKKTEVQPLDYSNFDWGSILKEDNMEILEKLNAGEYAVYSSDKGKIWVIAKLESDEETQLFQKENKFQLRSAEKKLDITLPSDVITTGKTISSKQWNGVVTILIE